MVILLDKEDEYFLPSAFRNIEDSQRFHLKSFVFQSDRFVI